MHARSLINAGASQANIPGFYFPKSINDNGAAGNYSVTPVINDPATYECFRIYLAAAWGLWRNPGPVGAVRLERHPTDQGYSGGTVFVVVGMRKKFQILHDLGHWVEDRATQGVLNAAQNYRWYDPACPRDLTTAQQNACDPVPGNGDGLEDGGFNGVAVPGVCCSTGQEALCQGTAGCLPAACSPNHELRSMEWVGSAVGEGFVNFFSAAAWNDTTENADCVFRNFLALQLGGGATTWTVDCEAASDGAPRKYMRDTCDNDGFTNHGVELDWFRAFWDMRTNTNVFGRPSYIDMIDWLDHAGTLNYYNAYNMLDYQAVLEDLSLETAWNTAKAYGTTDGNGL